MKSKQRMLTRVTLHMPVDLKNACFKKDVCAGEEWICWLEECFKSKKQKSVMYEGEPVAAHPPSNTCGNNRVPTVCIHCFKVLNFCFRDT
jgi:hypothetical protein